MTRSFHTHRQLAFTIIELLVVISIIALLVGILLPAIGKARDQAQLTRSQANIKQLGTAAVTYAAEFSDRQVTWINDNMSSYGNMTPTAVTMAFQNYNAKAGTSHPHMYLGYGRNGGVGTVWGYGPPPETNGTPYPFQPIVFLQGSTAQGFGSFRIPNAKAFSTYVNGRFYDPTFYAPKDTSVINSVESVFEDPDEFPIIPNTPPGTVRWSSYCFSPAAMFSPSVFGKHATQDAFFTNPWLLQAGFRSPGMSQATYSNLKTHIMEHNWLQGKKKPCNPGFTGGPYENCTPYYFNHGYNSAPVALFYDGHVGAAGQADSIDANARMVVQTGDSNHGLWSLNTTLGPNPGQGGGYSDGMDGGYFMTQGSDFTSTSYHVLTIDGIKGRDFVSK